MVTFVCVAAPPCHFCYKSEINFYRPRDRKAYKENVPPNNNPKLIHFFNQRN